MLMKQCEYIGINQLQHKYIRLQNKQHERKLTIILQKFYNADKAFGNTNFGKLPQKRMLTYIHFDDKNLNEKNV